MVPDALADSEDDRKVLSNFQISRRLIHEKTNLVNALSHFPVAAVWLVHHYEQQCDTVQNEEDEDVVLLSEPSEVLSEIQYHLQLRHSSMSDRDNNPSGARIGLTEALARFPYSFHDLTRLVDLIVFVHQSRNTGHDPELAASPPDSDVIKKRLEGVRSRVRSDSAQFLNMLKTSTDGLYEDSFLFLSREEMSRILPRLVMSEYYWLHLRDRLAVANSRLVLYIANQYKGGFLDFDDLVQEGHAGLLKAVDRYNYKLGYKFSTYAGYWIRQAISRALSRSERVVRIPCGQMAVINKIHRTKELLAARMGKEPTAEELGEHSGLTPDAIHSILTISQSSVALEGSSDDESFDYSPIDYLEQQTYTHPFREMAQTDLEKLINKAIQLLSPREARIIRGHFGLQAGREMTLKEIGNEMNLTRERVRQIQVAALNKIRHSIYGSQLATCL